MSHGECSNCGCYPDKHPESTCRDRSCQRCAPTTGQQKLSEQVAEALAYGAHENQPFVTLSDIAGQDLLSKVELLENALAKAESQVRALMGQEEDVHVGAQAAIAALQQCESIKARLNNLQSWMGIIAANCGASGATGKEVMRAVLDLKGERDEAEKAYSLQMEAHAPELAEVIKQRDEARAALEQSIVLEAVRRAGYKERSKSKRDASLDRETLAGHVRSGEKLSDVQAQRDALVKLLERTKGILSQWPKSALYEDICEALAALERPAPADLYYIQNKGYCGDCLLWWREDGHGYTTNLDEAWRVSKEKAESICRDRPKEYIPHLVSKIDSLAHRHINTEALAPAPADGGKA